MNIHEIVIEDDLENIPLSIFIKLIANGHKRYLTNHIDDNITQCDNNYLNDLNKKITKGEYPFIMELYEKEQLTQQEIADTFQVTQANIARVLRHLEDINVIKRQIDDSNRRKKQVSLTSDGKKIALHIVELEDEWENIVLKEATPEDMRKLRELLYKIALNSLDIHEK